MRTGCMRTGSSRRRALRRHADRTGAPGTSGRHPNPPIRAGPPAQRQAPRQAPSRPRWAPARRSGPTRPREAGPSLSPMGTDAALLIATTYRPRSPRPTKAPGTRPPPPSPPRRSGVEPFAESPRDACGHAGAFARALPGRAGGGAQRGGGARPAGSRGTRPRRRLRARAERMGQGCRRAPAPPSDHRRRCNRRSEANGEGVSVVEQPRQRRGMLGRLHVHHRSTGAGFRWPPEKARGPAPPAPPRAHPSRRRPLRR